MSGPFQGVYLAGADTPFARGEVKGRHCIDRPPRAFPVVSRPEVPTAAFAQKTTAKHTLGWPVPFFPCREKA